MPLKEWWGHQQHSALIAGAVFAVVYVLWLIGSQGQNGDAKQGQDADATRAADILIHQVIRPDDLGPDESVVAFRLPNALPAGSRVSAYLPDAWPESAVTRCANAERVLDRPAWFFWVDDAVGARFSHPTRYVLVDAATYEVTSVETQGWWPCVDGRPVQQWVDDEQRVRPEHHAFARIAEPASARGVPPGLGRNDVTSARVSPHADTSRRDLVMASRGLRLLGDLVSSQQAAEKHAVVTINGWSEGQTGAVGFHADVERARLFAAKFGVPFVEGAVGLKESPIARIRTAIDQAIAGGQANTVFLHLVAHGDVDRDGKSLLVMGNQTVTAGNLRALLREYSGRVSFNLAVDGCRSQEFRSLAGTDNIQQVVTCADSIHDLCLADENWRAGSNGGRFSRGLFEHLSATSDPFGICMGCAVAEAARLGKDRVKGQVKFWPKCRFPNSGGYYSCGISLALADELASRRGSPTPSPTTTPSPVVTASPTRTVTVTATPRTPTPSPTSSPGGVETYEATFRNVTLTYTKILGDFDSCRWRRTFEGKVTLDVTFDRNLAATGTIRVTGSSSPATVVESNMRSGGPPCSALPASTFNVSDRILSGTSQFFAIPRTSDGISFIVTGVPSARSISVSLEISGGSGPTNKTQVSLGTVAR